MTWSLLFAGMRDRRTEHEKKKEREAVSVRASGAGHQSSGGAALSDGVRICHDIQRQLLYSEHEQHLQQRPRVPSEESGDLQYSGDNSHACGVQYQLSCVE